MWAYWGVSKLRSYHMREKMADEEASVQNVEMEVTEDSKDVTENKDQKPAEKDKDVLTFEGRTYDG